MGRPVFKRQSDTAFAVAVSALELLAEVAVVVGDTGGWVIANFEAQLPSPPKEVNIFAVLHSGIEATDFIGDSTAEHDISGGAFLHVRPLGVLYGVRYQIDWIARQAWSADDILAPGVAFEHFRHPIGFWPATGVDKKQDIAGRQFHAQISLFRNGKSPTSLIEGYPLYRGEFVADFGQCLRTRRVNNDGLELRYALLTLQQTKGMLDT